MGKYSKIAKKYAKTLFHVVDLDSFEDTLGQLSVINDLLEKNRDIRASLVSPLFDVAEKEKAVDVISDLMEVTVEVRKFLKFVVSEGKASLLPVISEEAITLFLEKKKKAKATVISPVEFKPDLKNRLKKSLESITAKEVDIEYINDPELLGGFVVKIGSTMYDSSLKGQLRLLKDELIKG